MNKIILKGLLSCIVMGQVLAIAVEDPDSDLKALLGDYADVKPVLRTHDALI